MKTAIFATLLFLGAAARPALAADDILVADFESADYGAWTVEGEAFGPGPARGALPGQMSVSGYRGERLVNSFFKGDGTTGTLTSPAFTIQRDYIVFLIGGGGFPGETCMNLLVNGETVRTATGPNTQSGGSEELSPAFWDVRPWKGRAARVQIVDQATGGWGHINVDHIVQTDQKPDIPNFEPLERSFVIEKPFLSIPIQNGARATDLILEVNGRPVRHYNTELATTAAKADWHAYFTLDEYKGQRATLRATTATEEGFALIQQTDRVPGSERWYSEELRPQLRFSQDVGWNNDPNGMVCLDGEWHLFFQHNPVGWKWGNMTWGHAVSTDLVHWKQLPDALFPKTTLRGDAFSGGATVDIRNTAGWKTGDNDVLVVFLTDTGAGESVAYSNDRGRTFTWYEGNPVVKHQGRDPKVIWRARRAGETPLNERARELGGHWVMAVYDEHKEHKQNIAFYTSTDLKNWELQSHLPGFYECPEIFELPIDGDPSNTRWVLFAADARYVLGSFDGRRFTPEHEGKHRLHYGKYYASQTFENAPNGRRIQIGWAQIEMPGMPFNQTFSFPHELSLRATEEGVRLHANPVKELALLRGKERSLADRALRPESPVQVPVSGELFEIEATFEPGDASAFGFEVGGERVVYDAAARKLDEAPLQPLKGRVTIWALVDRPMLEISGNDGRVWITRARRKREPVSAIRVFAEGGSAKLVSIRARELKSIW